MSDAQATGTTRESSVRNQGALLTQVHTLDIRGGIQHLLHTRTALRPLVGDHHAVATLHLTTEDALTGVFLRIEHHGRTLEMPQALIHASSLHHTAVVGNISEEHSESAVLRIGMLQVADTSIGAVGIECTPLLTLRTHLRREAVAGSRLIDTVGLCIHRAVHDTVFLHGLSQRHAVHTGGGAVDKATLVQFIQDAQDTTCTSALLYRILLRVRSQLTQARHTTRELVDILHREVGASLLGHSQQMEHGVRRSTHGDIQRHRVHKGLAGGDIARQHALVAVFVISEGVLHHLTGSSLKQLHAVGMRSQDRSVARQTQADGLRQRVHRVGRKHARAASTAWAGTSLYLLHLLISHRGVGTLHHGRNQVGILTAPLTSLHGASRTEHRGDVQSHRSHQHTRRHLVAVRDADHGVGLMGVHHILHAVGDDVARRQ